jgi:hypothetical protein
MDQEIKVDLTYMEKRSKSCADKGRVVGSKEVIKEPMMIAKPAHIGKT